MTTIQHDTRGHPIRLGLSGLIISVVMIGIGVGATFAVMGGVLDNLDSMAGSNKVIVESVNAYTNNDRMVITGNIKNIGNTALTSVLIDEISAGDLVITQDAATGDGQIVDGHGNMVLVGLQHDGNPVSFSNPVAFNATLPSDVDHTPTSSATAGHVWHGGGAQDDRFYFLGAANVGGAYITVTGLSTDDDELVSLPAGVSQAFRIVITGESQGATVGLLDVLRTVPAGSELFITIAGTNGQTSTISDVRTTNVKAR